MKALNKKIILVTLIAFIFSSAIAKDKIKELQDNIDPIVKAANCTVSVQVVSADKYDLLYSYHPQEKMIPASITKLITSITALQVLGSGYNFKTIVYTDDNNLSDGVINGNIYIKGFGDPDLYSADIGWLAKGISEKKITEVTGNVIFDESFLDNNHYGLADYYQNDTKKRDWPYITALTLNKNSGGYDPASTAAEQLKVDLESMSIKIDGIVVSGKAPAGAKQLSEFSHTILDVLTNMNKISDNLSAITVFKVIGAKYKGEPGTLDKGEQAVNEFLTSIGTPRTIFEILEGSGLTRKNTVTSDLYIALLKYIYDDEKTFDFLYQTLPIGGKDGTLAHRMIGTEAEGNVHAKTGTLNSVSALAGFAVSRDNELLIFYINMNGFGGGSNNVRKMQDDICAYLCAFTRK